jgi:hypothetical protein
MIGKCLKAGLASTLGFIAGMLLMALLGRYFGIKTLLFFFVPPLASLFTLRQSNRLGLVQTWFPGNGAAGTTVGFLVALPFSLAAGIRALTLGSMQAMGRISTDAVYLSIVLGTTGLAMIAGGALASIPQKPCAVRIAVYGFLATALITLSWTALFPQ